MKPFIKWPGGKERELRYILPAKPNNIRNYVEPFLGGGAVFFALKEDEVSGNFSVNDLSDDLIDTYKFVKEHNEDFFAEMMLIDQNNKEMAEVVTIQIERINQLYDNINNLVYDELNRLVSLLQQHISDNTAEDSKTEEEANLEETISEETIVEDQLKIKRKKLLSKAQGNVKDRRNAEIEQFLTDIQDNLVLLGNLNQGNDVYFDSIKAMIVRRINSMIQQNDLGEETNIVIADVFECIFKSAFYSHIRNLYNHRNDEDSPYNQAQMAAMYLFIRENCFSAMHRTNEYGEFNVPYGGISYNKHDFGKKRASLMNKALQERLRRTTISNRDFEEFLIEILEDATAEDFWFIDPPYDSAFSEYSRNEFSQADHIRLANLLSRAPAKAMVVIKRTEFIENLYRQYDNFRITNFAKNYDVNFYNRNQREVEHLIITNYELATEDTNGGEQ